MTDLVTRPSQWPTVNTAASRIAALLLCGALAACAAPDPGVSKRELVDTPLAGCCDSAEFYPPPLVQLANPFAPVVGRVVGSIVMRAGYIATPAAHEAVQADLRPLDLLFMSSKGRLSGRMLPGLFSHVVIYLGTEDELKRLGIWDDPAIVPHHDAIRKGKIFIESDSPGVHLSDVEYVLGTDAVAVLRPPINNRARRRDVVRNLALRLGSDFDFYFDNASTDVLYCAELAAMTMPEAGMPTRRLYGRRTILPDDAVALAVTGRSEMDFVSYVRGTETGWSDSDGQTLMTDMIANWNRPKAGQEWRRYSSTD